MAHYEINRVQDRIIVVSDADTTEVSLTPLNGTETDYFIEASTDHMWKRVGSDVVGYDYTDLGAIGGGGGGGNIVDTWAATLGAGNTTGGHDANITDGDDVVFLGNSSSIIFPIDSSGTQSKITTGTYGMQILSDATPVLIFDNNLGQITTPNAILAGALVTGVPSVQNGTLGFKNSADSSEVTLSSTAAKQLKIDNTGHDVKVGINGAAVGGVALNVVGEFNSGDAKIGLSTPYLTKGMLGVSGDTAYIGDAEGEGNSTAIIISDNISTRTISMFAASGVTTSAGLTVGTTIASAANEAWDLGGGNSGTGTPAPADSTIRVTIGAKNYDIAATYIP